MITTNLIALLLASIVLISIFRSKYVRIALSAILGVFFVMELSSLYLGNSFIDYKYYEHFTLDAFLMAGGFKKEIVLAVFLLAALPVLLFFISRTNIPQNIRHRIAIKSTVFAAAMLVLSVSTNGVFGKLKEIYDILSTPVPNDFSAFFSDRDTSALFNDRDTIESKQSDTLINKSQTVPIIFTNKKNLRAKFSGKNIVIISLESFEKAFLHDENKHLTPNLRKRARQWAFYEMRQNGGSGWTSASLYTVLTGLPSYFIGHRNIYFYGAKKSQLISLINILKRGGYEQYHLSNNATFAGTRDILTTFGVDHVIDDEIIVEGGDGCPYGGAWDKDVFGKAKNIVHQMDSIRKPFMLWISTIQTHIPDGVVDDKMLEFVKKQETTLETAALSTDWLVEDFLVFLEREGLMKNTVVYLFPDHLFMGNKEIFDRTKKPRSLWFMTNAAEKDLHIDAANFYQIDIIGNILSGAKIKHNAKFLADFINEDKGEFINKNVKLITAINMTSIVREQTLGESIYLNIKNSKLICLINRDTLFVQDIDSIKHTPVNLLLSKELKILSIKHTNDDLFDDYYYDNYIRISIKDALIDFDWIRDNAHTYSQRHVSKIKMDSKEIAAIIKHITPDEVIIKHIMPDEVNTFRGNDFDRGVVESAPTIKDSALVEYLSAALEDSSNVIIMSCHDEASIHFGKLKPILEKTGLRESLEGKVRWSYLAAFSNHRVYCERMANSVCLHKRFVIESIPIYLASDGWNANCFSYGNGQHIVINNQEYSLGLRGLNIAILNTKNRKVVDAFNVDLYGDEKLTIKR